MLEKLLLRHKARAQFGKTYFQIQRANNFCISCELKNQDLSEYQMHNLDYLRRRQILALDDSYKENASILRNNDEAHTNYQLLRSSLVSSLYFTSDGQRVGRELL